MIDVANAIHAFSEMVIIIFGIAAGTYTNGYRVVGDDSQGGIGAGAVVTSDIPAHCLAVGVPAKVVKKYAE